MTTAAVVGIGTARWVLRAYAGSTTLIIVAGVLAVAAVLPVVSLVVPRPLALPTLPEAHLDIIWTGVSASPTALQERALAVLSGLLLAVAVAVLAVAVLTIFGLATARSAARRTEIGVRRAVGASRRQLVAAGLVEGAALSAVALAIGVPMGIAGLRLAAAAWPGVAPGGGVAPAVAVTLGVGAAIALGALFPVWPRPRDRPAVPPGALPHGRAVPAVQLGMSLTVLVAAGQLARHAAGLIGDGRVPDASGGEIFEITLPPGSSAERAAGHARLLGRLAHDFDVVSLSSPGALDGAGTVDLVTTDCGRCAQGGVATPQRVVRATVAVVSADTFRAIGIRLTAGRGIGEGDAWGGPRVAVVSRSLAARHFEGGEAVGRRLLVGRGPDDGWYTVVGVVHDFRGSAVGSGLRPAHAVYLSALQQPPRAFELLVRPPAGPSPTSGRGQAVLESLGAGAVIARRVTEPAHLATELGPVRWLGRMFRFQGTMALVIAMLGTFAAMQLWARAMMPELAVRRAVGARRRTIFAFVLWRGAAIAVAGVALALWLGELVSGLLSSLVAGLPAWDATLVIPPALALAGAALAGTLIPAWRAAGAAPATLTASGS